MEPSSPTIAEPIWDRKRKVAPRATICPSLIAESSAFVCILLAFIAFESSEDGELPDFIEVNHYVDEPFFGTLEFDERTQTGNILSRCIGFEQSVGGCLEGELRPRYSQRIRSHPLSEFSVSQ